MTNQTEKRIDLKAEDECWRKHGASPLQLSEGMRGSIWRVRGVNPFQASATGALDICAAVPV